MAGYSTMFEEIVFVEGAVPDVRVIGGLLCDLSFRFGAQLKNLNDVKKDLAQKARVLGANAVINFKYGQKSQWLAVDDVAYFGSGQAAVLPQEEYDRIRNEIAARHY